MKKSSSSEYVKNLKMDSDQVSKSQQSFISQKSEMHKLLESLIDKDDFSFDSVGDIACGAGVVSYWLNKKFKKADYHLIDLNNDLLEKAKSINEGPNFHFYHDDIYNLSNIGTETFDLTICWQTLSWLDKPQKAIEELIRITKKGGRIYISSLFDTEHDVDIYAKVKDWSRESSKRGSYYLYNTYSKKTVNDWLINRVDSKKFIDFKINKDLKNSGKGLGTYTIRSKDGERLQFSASLFLNWKILKIIK